MTARLLSDAPVGSVAREGTWVRFIAILPNEKTPRFGVVTKKRSDQLGVVSWNGGWWRYAFTPDARTYYEATCLREIADFLADLTKEWKAHRGQSRRGKR